jgi:cell division protease FtsH
MLAGAAMAVQRTDSVAALGCGRPGPCGIRWPGGGVCAPPQHPTGKDRCVDRQTQIRLLVAVVLVLILVAVFSGFFTSNATEVSYHPEFKELVKGGQVESVTITGQSVEGEFAQAGSIDDTSYEKGDAFSTTLPNESVVGGDGRVEQLLADNNVTISAEEPSDGFGRLLLIWLFVLGLFVLFFWYMSRQARGQMGQIGKIGKSQAKLHKPHEPDTRFDDVAGYQEVKQETKEVVAFLSDPDKFRKAGAEVPKGMLMVGPPGTGKTLLARAVAGEAGVPFITVTGSDFMEMFVGVGASRVRDLFKTARQNAPCIVFIDELDSIGRKRGAGMGGGHDEREQTLNQLLGEIDGFEGSEGIVLMGATNRPDVLDPALQRPGRFDRQIVVPLPTIDERTEILQVHTKGKPIGDDVDLSVVARATPGMAGADLKNMVNEAALIAVRRGSDVVEMADLEAARERVTIGRERASLALDENEKETVAYHEGGHALAAFLESEADPVYKVSVLPVGQALGVTTQLPTDEQHIYLRSYLDARLRVMLGGRAAEMVVLGQPTTGGQNDLVQATRLARAVVREYGMGKLGPVGYGDDQQVFLGEDLARQQEHSDRTAELIDEEVREILNDALDAVCRDFERLRPGLDAMVRLLVEREALSGEEALKAVRDAVGPEEQLMLRGDAVTPAHSVDMGDAMRRDTETEVEAEQGSPEAAEAPSEQEQAGMA